MNEISRGPKHAPTHPPTAPPHDQYDHRMVREREEAPSPIAAPAAVETATVVASSHVAAAVVAGGDAGGGTRAAALAVGGSCRQALATAPLGSSMRRKHKGRLSVRRFMHALSSLGCGAALLPLAVNPSPSPLLATACLTGTRALLQPASLVLVHCYSLPHRYSYTATACLTGTRTLLQPASLVLAHCYSLPHWYSYTATA